MICVTCKLRRPRCKNNPETRRPREGAMPPPAEHICLSTFEPREDRSEHVLELLKNPGLAQRTPAWYERRKSMITASDLGQMLGVGKFGTPDELLVKKCMDVKFDGSMEAMLFGVRYEDVALQCYRRRARMVQVHEFGLLEHPTLPCFGASPDGITDRGVMIEIKCPSRRAIVPDSVPEQYAMQIQGQLEVAGLETCHYVEAGIDQVDHPTIWKMRAAQVGPDAGIAVGDPATGSYEYSPSGMTPDQVMEWAAEREGHKFMWVLREIHITAVHRDREMWRSIAPRIREFWERVERGRERVAQDLPPEPGVKVTVYVGEE